MANPHEAHETAGALGGGSTEMDCGAALFELYRYLDGELPTHDRVRIGQHLQDCEGCLSLFDFEQVLWRVVRLHLAQAHSALAPPPTLAARITISVEAEARDLPAPNLPEGGLNGPN